MKEETESKYIVYFDGACEPINPGGTASYGAVIYKDEKLVWECSDIYRPEPGQERRTTSNLAEYLGVIAVLQWFAEQRLFEADILIRGDSQMVIEQMFGDWQIKGGAYVPFAKKARGLRLRFRNIEGEWIRRDLNKVADGLCKAALERAGVKSKFKKGKRVMQDRVPANDDEPSTGAVKAG